MAESRAPQKPVVVKVGTSLLRGDARRNTEAVIAELARVLSTQRQQGLPLVLVSSGAVGLGSRRLGNAQRPQDLQQQQVAAAVGQGLLMAAYDKAFGQHNQLVAQVLLTRGDLASRHRYRNAAGTLVRLLERGVVPVVNENDALATDELRFGDNDTIAALVAVAVAASRLILLTDVDRLYSANPRRDASANPIHTVQNRAELQTLLPAAESGGRWGTGGMPTKLAAARIAFSFSLGRRELHVVSGLALPADQAPAQPRHEFARFHTDVGDAVQSSVVVRDLVQGLCLRRRPREAVQQVSVRLLGGIYPLGHHADGDLVRHEHAALHVHLGQPAQFRIAALVVAKQFARGHVRHSQEPRQFGGLRALASAGRAEQHYSHAGLPMTGQYDLRLIRLNLIIVRSPRSCALTAGLRVVSSCREPRLP